MANLTGLQSSKSFGVMCLISSFIIILHGFAELGLHMVLVLFVLLEHINGIIWLALLYVKVLSDPSHHSLRSLERKASFHAP